jgi:hypothetical protein
VPFPIVAGIVTEPSKIPLASVVNVLSSFGVEKAHTSTEEFALKPDANTLTAAPALTVALPASIVTSVVAGNTMHKAPATKGLATVVEATVVEVVVGSAGTLEHTRTPCGVAATTASTEVPSAEVTRPLPGSAAGAVGDTKGVLPAAAVVVAPAFTVVELAGATVEDVVAAAVVEGATVEDVVVVAAVVVGAVVDDVVVVAAVVVVSATVVAGSTVEACATPSCAKPAIPITPARRSTLVARVVECVMLYSFRHVQVRTAKEHHDLALSAVVMLCQVQCWQEF